MVEIFPAAASDYVIRVEFFGDEIDRISEINPLTGECRALLQHAAIYPASHYIVPAEKMQRGHRGYWRTRCRNASGISATTIKLLEAQRIEQRTKYDIEMLQEIGFCKGIENYSRVLSRPCAGERAVHAARLFPEGFSAV